jgi:3-deoxy-D-manno-octulosonate 8-phosphate phosphatase KdsC-like HAD superfamily phosphatase
MAINNRLAQIGRQVRAAVPSAAFAEDQPFRKTSLGFVRPEDPDERAAIIAALREAGADVTVNDLWVLGWLGGYDKLSMTRRVLAASYEVEIDVDRDSVLYVGDSTNDAPMFGFFRHTVGVSTVRRYLPDIPTPPRWIAAAPGGEGFVEAANAVIASQGFWALQTTPAR